MKVHLNNALFKQQENTAPLTLDQVFVGQWRFLLPQDSNAPTMHLTISHFKAHGHPWVQVHLQLIQLWRWRESDNCVGRKLTITVALHTALHRV